MFTVQLSYRLLLFMVARIFARYKKIKYEALDTGEESSDELKRLINIEQEVNH